MSRSIVDTFRLFDRNGDGRIDYLELSMVLSALDKRWTQARLNKLFQVVDQDQNGSIEYDEFVTWAFGHPSIRTRDIDDFRSAVVTSTQSPSIGRKLHQGDRRIEEQREAIQQHAFTSPTAGQRISSPSHGQVHGRRTPSPARLPGGGATAVGGWRSPSRSPRAGSPALGSSGSPSAARGSPSRLSPSAARTAQAAAPASPPASPLGAGGASAGDSPLESLFGPKLATRSGTRSTSKVLAGKKAILVYFSAQFSPPCQNFTPMLAQMYRKHTAKDIEVVFASSDANEENFANYYFEMPWAAVPFARADVLQELRDRFKVDAVPQLVVLTGEGELTVNNGRDTIVESRSLAGALRAWGLDAAPVQAAAHEAPGDAAAAGGPSRVQELFHDTLLTKEGPKPTNEVLANKIGILLYFVARGAPPCSQFTQQLVDAYGKHTANDLEVILVSCDEDEETFLEHYEGMPWAAAPFGLRDALCGEFSVRSCPKLVVLDHRDGESEVIAVNGVSQVQTLSSLAKCAEAWDLYPRDADQEPDSQETAAAGGPGAQAKAPPKSLVEILGGELVTKDGTRPTAEVLEGKKAVLLYFSAHWCPPCRAFTPQLADAYRRCQRTDVEIVFVSADRDDAAFQGYFGEMPWTAVPFATRNTVDGHFDVRGIPTLVVLNAAGELVTMHGRTEVAQGPDLESALEQWGL